VHEQRRHFRKRVDLAVQFSGEGTTPATGICRDLSMGGMHVDTDTPAAFGAQIAVVVRLRGQAEDSRIPATVRWVKKDSMGLQFGLLGAHDTYALSETLSGE
jgi:hypothetical protein